MRHLESGQNLCPECYASFKTPEKPAETNWENTILKPPSAL
jgi:hypothetical protein